MIVIYSSSISIWKLTIRLYYIDSILYFLASIVNVIDKPQRNLSILSNLLCCQILLRKSNHYWQKVLELNCSEKMKLNISYQSHRLVCDFIFIILCIILWQNVRSVPLSKYKGVWLTDAQSNYALENLEKSSRREKVWIASRNRRSEQLSEHASRFHYMSRCRVGLC